MFKSIFNTKKKYKNKKIGVFYICTGKYNIFWERFYHSSEKYFCPGIPKQYFIFTDSEIAPKGNNVTIIEQKKLGWPFDTLMRFHMFNGIKDQALLCDYLYFFNANMVFLKKVSPNQILPTITEELVGVSHPFFYAGTDSAPFEKNPQSTAFVFPNKAKHYIAGGLSGGISSKYMEMSEQIANNIDNDTKNGIVAIWHDESHINAYFSNRESYKILNAGYIVPEKRLKSFPFKPYLVVLDKVFAGGHESLRN